MSNRPDSVTNPLLPLDLAQRRRESAPGTSLGALADALAEELAPMAVSDLDRFIPPRKARLTRIGGRCPVHGTYLEFDPWQPHAHRCLTCNTTYAALEHDQWWAMGAQLWLVERAVHAAALYALRGDPQHRHVAEIILAELAARYRGYPNRDNVLGPTRPFFSTYLESIWLLNVCQALALLEQVGPVAVGGAVREQVVEPSRALIAGYHEGRSNRQVWNGAAQLVAALVLGDASAADAQLTGANGVVALLTQGLGPDGGWYEGENYHLFAHRGFWYVAQAMAAQGLTLPVPAATRYARGFRFPFSGLLPDECFPSRKDSQYRVSIRQWRIAEYIELGYAATGDDTLAGLLARVYDGSVARVSDARARSTADAERNEPPMALSRASLSWRALLGARAVPPPACAWVPGSASREQEGLAVIRRQQARVFVGLEGGGDARGHGHPDALALTLQADQARWLEDPGTGSYVDRSLFWYRSTLAHHAPLVNGASQRAAPATVLNFEDRGGAGWMRKRVDLTNGVTCTRAVIVADGYLVDVLEWSAPHAVTVTLPVAASLPRNAVRGAGAWTPTERAGAGGEEDGFGFLDHVHEAALAEPMISWTQVAAGRPVQAWYAATGTPRAVHAGCPGAPGAPATTRLLLEAHGAAGRVVGVWAWGEAGDPAAVATVALHPDEPVVAVVTTGCGTCAEHGPAAHGWHIALRAAGARSSIDLEGAVQAAALRPPAAAPPEAAAPTGRIDVPSIEAAASLEHLLPVAWTATLGAASYVATEEPHGPGNPLQAHLALAATEHDLVVRVDVHTGHPLVSVGGGPAEPPPNPLDNEPADVNADSLQWYIGAAEAVEWTASGLVALLPGGEVRHTRLTPGTTLVPTACGRARADGWTLQLCLPRRLLPAGPVRFHVTVNERPADRERRRGQLRLAGGGFRRYIAGPREDAAACPVWLHLPAVGTAGRPR